jgi:hypothetical protein
MGTRLPARLSEENEHQPKRWQIEHATPQHSLALSGQLNVMPPYFDFIDGARICKSRRT